MDGIDTTGRTISGKSAHQPGATGSYPNYSMRAEGQQEDAGQKVQLKDRPYDRVTGEFCLTCIKQDVCSIKSDLLSALEIIDNTCGRVNVFADAQVQCRKYYPDAEHQNYPDYMYEHDSARASSDPSRVSTVLLRNECCQGGMRNE